MKIKIKRRYDKIDENKNTNGSVDKSSWQYVCESEKILQIKPLAIQRHDY